MARTEQEFLDTFESGTVALDTGAINMPVDKFSKRFGITEQEETLSRVLPEEYKLSDVNTIKLKEQGNISVKLRPKDLFEGTLTDIEDEDAKSLLDKVTSRYKTPTSFSPVKEITPDIKKGDRVSVNPLGRSGQETAEDVVQEGYEGERPPSQGLDPDFEPLTDYLYDKGKDLYDYIFHSHDVSNLSTVGSYNVDNLKYTMGIPTGLGTTASQSSIGLSSAPPASLAGSNFSRPTMQYSSLASSGISAFANVGLSVPAGTVTGLGTQATVGAAGAPGFSTGLRGTTPPTSTASSAIGSAASLYGIYSGIKEKDYFSAGLSLMTLINPATALPAAILQGAKMLFGAWSDSKRPKPKFGGADFKAEKNRLMATEGYGYNGYQPSAGKATVASIADYVNTYVKTFGLQFNGSRWAKAIKADPRLNRYDNTNESGYADRSLLTRKIFETEGLITGTPTYNGQPITSQEDYKEKVKQFNEYYQKTALERGGLVDAAAVGIDPATLSNEYNKITFKVSNQVGGGGTGRQYVQRTTGGRGGGGTTQTGYWQTTGTGGRGGGNRVWVPAAPNVVVQSGGRNTGASAYAISYRYEDATPFDMLYKNLVGNFNRGQGGTYY